MGYLVDIGKETYIKEQGYTWEHQFDAYVSHENWKIFTRTYLDDHSFETILARLADEPTVGHWRIYTSTESEADIHNIHRHYGVPI